MRRTAVLMALVALGAAWPASSPGGRSAPTIRVVDLQPFTVRGMHFRARERVTVVAVVGRRYSRIVRASRTGTFSVRFPAYADMCTAYNLRVLGAAGSRVTLARKQPTSCAAVDPVP